LKPFLHIVTTGFERVKEVYIKQFLDRPGQALRAPGI
jgi:hypothetical protein